MFRENLFKVVMGHYIMKNLEFIFVNETEEILWNVVIIINKKKTIQEKNTPLNPISKIS